MPEGTSTKCLCLVIISVWQQLQLLFKAIKKGVLSYHFWAANTQEVISNCADTDYTTFNWHRRHIELSHQNRWIFFVILLVKRDQWGYSNTRNDGWSDGLHKPRYNRICKTSTAELGRRNLAPSVSLLAHQVPHWFNLCSCHVELYIL